jgi:hypothetical protein
MAYAEAQIKLGRQPFSYVELDLDFCANTFGVAPCTATGSGDAKCYNTYASCQDTANFNKITKTYRFCSPNGAKVPTGLDAIPCLRGITITPAEITAGQGLGLRAACSVSFQDFPHSDIRIDPYVTERTYKPIERGTFFGKLKARNPYYNGRIMRVYNGYLNDDGSFDIDNFERRTFVIEQWNGIDPNGITQITGKDILKLASDERAVCPMPSVGKITLDMTTGTTSINLTPTGVGSDYDASGYVRIGQEVMSYTRSGDTLTIVRGQKGTVAATHKQGDTVQLCKQYSGETSQDIVYDLLVNFANVDTVFINKPNWDAEQVAYLPRLYNTLITTPTGISKLLSELSEQVGFFLFWDEVDELIKFQTIRPNSPSETVKQLSSEYNLIADSLKTVDIVSDRVNEVWVYYGIIDHAKNLTDDANYSNLYIASNVGDQSAVRNNDIRIKKIVTRWITDGAAAIELGQRYLERFVLSPIQADFMLDAKDSSIKLCDFVELTSKQNQGFDGSPVAILMQVVKRLERQTGTTWAFTARQFAFSTDLNPVRRIEIDGSVAEELFDLDLKAAHDSRFAPATTGTVIEFVIKSGVVVSASSTANYAITNPSTWASGVFINLIVESGAAVAGCGGAGGAGGEGGCPPASSPAFSGHLSSADGVNGASGSNGGDALLVLYPITIDNLGIIAGGGGGGAGGAGGGGGVHNFGGYNYAGGSGGGGGGGAGRFYAGGAGLGAASVVSGLGSGGAGSNGFSGGSTTGGAGGAGGAGQVSGYTGAQGAGGAGGGGGNWGQNGASGSNGGDGNEYGFGYGGTGGTGGTAGAAIHGNSFITWTATGTIYGAII